MQISNVSAGVPSASNNPRSTTPHSAQSTAAAARPAVGASAPAAANAVPTPVGRIYSTTVGGKNYAGSVEQFEGQYTVSVPNLPGAVASGSTEQEAEISLTVKIDALA